MGLFNKGKQKKKGKVSPEQATMSDQIVYDKLVSDDDATLTGLADQMMDGHPLILNFEPLNIDQANKVVAFLSGVVYAIKGEIVHIKEKVFMFARADVFDDGSMEEFLKEIVE